MRPALAGDGFAVYLSDCIAGMARIPENSMHAVVTDPPYGLEFMGKKWDAPWQAGKGTGEHNAGFSPGAPAVAGVRGEIKALPSYTGSTNPTCRNCGGTRNGNDRNGRRACRCDVPTFPNTTLPRMEAFQAWSAEWAAQAFRVLRPGGHLLAFGGTRTWHRLAVAIEDAGFEIRDSIAWLYGSGFPKSLDISKAIDKGAGVAREVVGVHHRHGGGSPHSNSMGGGPLGTAGQLPLTAPATPEAQQWAGWGTALKPAFEPIVVARKPLTGTVAANTLAHGVGGLNIDGCRIEAEGDRFGGGANGSSGFVDGYERGSGFVTSTQGRWPANVVLDEHTAALVDAQSGIRPGMAPQRDLKTTVSAYFGADKHPGEREGYGDTGGASRFFYQAKAGKAERPKVDGQSHPTIKPLTLMRWLVRLVTPPGGYVLEPFAGSGTTIQAALMEGFKCIAFESEASYIPHIQARLTDAMLLQAPAQEPETETEEVSR